MQKPAKRKCPTCGGAVRVTNSVALVNTPTKVERFQHIKCTECGQRGILNTNEVIEWLSPK